MRAIWIAIVIGACGKAAPQGSGAREQVMALWKTGGLEVSAFSPLAFTCNFPTNAAVALVTVAVEDAARYPSLSALFARGTSDAAAASLAERLMKYAASDPSRLGAGGAPLAVHDRAEGVGALNNVLRAI